MNKVLLEKLKQLIKTWRESDCGRDYYYDDVEYQQGLDTGRDEAFRDAAEQLEQLISNVANVEHR